MMDETALSALCKSRNWRREKGNLVIGLGGFASVQIDEADIFASHEPMDLINAEINKAKLSMGLV